MIKPSILGGILIAMSTIASAGLFSKDVPEGMKQECLTKHSKAWCALDAANLARGFEDLKRDVVLKGSGSTFPVGTAIDIGMVGATAANWVRPIPGMSGGAEAGMLLLSLLTDRKAGVFSRDQVFGWMPIELADNSEDAYRLFHEAILGASMKALKAYSISEVTVSENLLKNDYSLDRYTNVAFDVTGEGCMDSKCTLIYQAPYKETHGRPKEGVAPDWMGGYKAWVFELYSRPPMLPHLLIGNKIENAAFAGEVSKYLPKWMVVSIAPLTNMYWRKTNATLKIPLVFSEGKVLAPIFPEVEFTQPIFKIGSGI